MIIVKVFSIEEFPFFWVINGNNVSGLKDGNMKKIEIKAEITEDGNKKIITIVPKIFFIFNNSIYFSADFNEKQIIEKEEHIITIEKYFEQNKGKYPIEIEALPPIPEIDFYIGNDGRYRIEKNQYSNIFISDTIQITTERFNRHLKVSNYYYGKFQIYTGAFIDVQEGLPNVREPGLYFWPDNKTSINKIMPEGRMFKF